MNSEKESIAAGPRLGRRPEHARATIDATNGGRTPDWSVPSFVSRPQMLRGPAPSLGVQAGYDALNDERRKEQCEPRPRATPGGQRPAAGAALAQRQNNRESGWFTM